ncbi:unnamed protein product (mitochondrion) [Plasmodiophora brassicae]|uniref:RGS domain-containing protein n=1 Tax=Plasmodiophora brassicae TaxID=37360 RepID=A0A3P3XZC7_PLABS|nr:unnamed protein product [Plasmodiophora brassicae]
MTGAAVVIFWIVTDVAVLAYGGVGLALFWIRMDLWPIRQRLPMEVLAGALFTWLCGVSLATMNVVVDYAPAFWMVYISQLFMLLAADTFTIVALTLWLMFNRTQDQLKIVQSVDDADRLRGAVRQLTIIQALLNRRPRIAYVVVNAVGYTVVAVWYASGYPELFTLVESDLSWDATSPATILENIGVYKMGVCMLLIIFLSYRLRIVSDSLGIKRGLKQVGISSLVGVVIYVFVTGPITGLTGGVVSVNSIVAVINCVIVITLSVHVPVRHSYSHRPGALDQVVCNIGQFEVFLCTTPGFTAFKRHLELEFALENLLFWKAAQDYRRTFAESSSRSARLALDIFQQYLAPNAPFEVNLDGDLLRLFRTNFPPGCGAGDLVQRGVLTRDLFSKASTTVLALMYWNSLGRFREAQPDVWEKFMHGAQEDAILAQFETQHTITIVVKPRGTESNKSLDTQQAGEE